MILFITFPSQVFNRSFDEAYDDVRELWERRLPRLEALRDRVVARGSMRHDQAIFTSVILVGALLGSLLSPRFGFNAASLAAFAAVVLALLVSTTVPAAISAIYRRRKHRRSGRHHSLPAGLTIAALCVLISRLSHFQPGYLYGLVCGVAFARQLADEEAGHVAALSAVTMLAVRSGLVCLGTGLCGCGSSGASLLLVLLEGFLAAVFVSGLVGTVINLLPFKFLPGGDVAGWHRGAWVATFAVALFGTVQVMLRPVTGPTHPGDAPVATAIVLFVVFGAASVSFRIFALRRQAARGS